MLEKIGFSIQFKASESGIKSLTTQRIYHADEISIINTYRFEERLPHQQTAILYAIETHNGERGTLVDYGGSEQDIQVGIFIRQVDVHKNNQTFR
ncbi:MAG: hypothetical protein IT257_03025 [Chitinophagaceae bacterium]|nr:hypothetical protein [Chitinophagaceae bacterium]